MMSIDQYRALVEAYFEASTTEEEEEKLKLFLCSSEAQDPSFDQIKAVMGLTTMLQRRIRINQHKSGKSPSELTTCKQEVSLLSESRRQLMRWAAIIILSLSVLTPAVVMWGLSDNDECVAYIDGRKITDEQIVIEEMHHTMEETLQDTPENQPALLLRDLFSTPQQ